MNCRRLERLSMTLLGAAGLVALGCYYALLAGAGAFVNLRKD